LRLDLNAVDTIDFETYYDKDYSLRSKGMNTSEYIRDPRFLAHCVSIKQGAGETKVYWYGDIKPALYDLHIGTRPVVAHNAPFDGAILAEHYEIVPPPPPLSGYVDTVSMARALHGNSTRASLDALMEFYGKPGKNPNILGKMKGFREIPQEIRAEAEIYCAGDTDKCYWLLCQWAAVYPEAELDLIDWTVRQFCDPVLYVDIPRATAELEREIARKKELIDKTGLDEEELQSAAKFAAQLKALDVEPPMKRSARTHMMTYAFSQQDDEFMDLVVHPDPRVRELMAARLAAKSTIGETRAQRFVSVGARPLPVGLNYFAAHTGRWGGTNKMNLQNLEKKEIDEATGEIIPLTGELRECIVAPEGHVIVVADSGQIECRTTAWMAGQEDLLDLFRSGGDPYCAQASGIYGRAITKADRDERAVGKAAVLGLGFYMGAARFQATLALGLLGPKIEMDIQDCWRVVNAYRNQNNKIVEFWAAMGVVISTMWKKRHILGQGGTTVFKQGVFEYDEQTIWLPNGLGLHYPDLGVEEDELGRSQYSYRSNKEFPRLHAGILTENVIQGLARIIIGEQLLRINERFRAVMMTHDEIVAIAPVHQAQECLDFMLAEMATSPGWAPDLPLKAEGGYDTCYSK
jgi:hypothetical protein